MVNVIVLFAKIEEAKSIKNLLVRHGINVTQVCTTGAQAAQAADACDDGLIICGYQYPDMLFSELAANIPDYFDMLVIASRVHYEACRESGITCLPMPLRTQDFINTVSLTVENILWERKNARQNQRNAQKMKKGN